MPTDHMIDTGTVPVYVRDHGGTGRPLVLLHGAGADLTTWDAVISALGQDFRVVTVDFRGHGRSGAGTWNWEAVLDDFDAVVAALNLSHPAVIGHSVGGLVAARWARRHPDCPAAASLDGHRIAGTHLGDLDPAAAPDADLADLSQSFTEWFGNLFAQWESNLRPEQATASAMTRAALATDNLDSLRGVDVPFLVLVAESSGSIPAQWEPLMIAFRADLWRDLRTLVDTQPHLQLRGIDTAHAMITEAPRETAEIIVKFLAATTPTTN